MSTTFGRIGRIAGLAAAVLAVVALLALLHPANWIAGQVLGTLALIGLLQGAAFTAVQWRMFGRLRDLADVAARGRPTVADVRSVAATSSRVGANPVVRMELTIDGVTRRHSVLLPVHLAHAVRPGASLPVRFDPDKPRALVVEWDRV